MTTTQSLSALTTGTWTIEPAHSEVGFTVRHLGMSKVRGRFNTFSGSVTIGDSPGASSVVADIDLSSVDTNNADRDDHLRSADFFNAETTPRMGFESTTISENILAGNLTINGVTRPVELDLDVHGVAVDPYEMTRAGFSASGVIKRSEYGIHFNAPFGLEGALISDKVNVELEIQLVPAS